MSRRLQLLAAGDAASVLPMMRRFYRHFRYPFSLRKQGAAFRRLLCEPALGRAWRIEEGGVVAGYAILVFGWSIEYGGRVAMLDELFIESSHRNRGLGAWTLRRIRVAARKLDVRQLLLEVEADNLRGQALYRRLGYRDTRRRLLARRP
jgi:ribosomal protein S18 acetylase RimI-like enzyme